MMDWLDRIPDSMTGALVSGMLWFGFNYVVLAPRALEQASAATVMPQCLGAIDQQHQHLRAAIPKMGNLLPGFRELDQWQARVIELAVPRPLTLAEKSDRCACAMQRAQHALQFEYAVHTASFRLIKPEAVANISGDAIATVLAGTCGVLPTFKRER